MAMTISIDDDLKDEFSNVCKEMGLTPSAAFGVFARAVVREQAIPFEVSAVSRSDRSYAAARRATDAQIAAGYRDFCEGRTMTREQAERMRDGQTLQLAEAS